MHTEWVVAGVLGVLLLLLLMKRKRAQLRAQKYLDNPRNHVANALGRILDPGGGPTLDSRTSKAKLTVIKG